MLRETKLVQLMLQYAHRDCGCVGDSEGSRAFNNSFIEEYIYDWGNNTEVTFAYYARMNNIFLVARHLQHESLPCSVHVL